MKILFDHPLPFLLAHGGLQRQIELTKAALEAEGPEVEWLRWWDAEQYGDLIHSFGIPSAQFLELAKKKGLPVVVTSVFSATCNRSDARLKRQGLIVRTLLRMPGWGSVKKQLSWDLYAKVDRNIVGLNAEADVLRMVYGVNDNRIQVVPLGIDHEFQNVSRSDDRQDYLISVGTITQAKCSLDLARLAKKAETPVLFVGKPIDEQDPYWLEFRRLIDNRFVRYAPHINDVSQLIEQLRMARGFVLYSEYENWSLAAHEAAACGLPLLLPDLKWSRERFVNQTSYFPGSSVEADARALADFHAAANSLPAPKVDIPTWNAVAAQLIEVYRGVLNKISRVSDPP